MVELEFEASETSIWIGIGKIHTLGIVGQVINFYFTTSNHEWRDWVFQGSKFPPIERTRQKFTIEEEKYLISQKPDFWVRIYIDCAFGRRKPETWNSKSNFEADKIPLGLHIKLFSVRSTNVLFKILRNTVKTSPNRVINGSWKEQKLISPYAYDIILYENQYLLLLVLFSLSFCAL